MTCDSAIEAENRKEAAPPPTMAPRRPRVREVRSRFMSPVVSSSSSGDLHLAASKSPKTSLEPQHRSISAQRRRQLDLEPLLENRTDISRSLETPLVKPHMSTQRRHPQPRSVKENSDPDNIGKFPIRTSSRSDTPTVSTSMDRTLRSSLKRSVSAGPTAAAKLLHASGMSMSMSFSGPQRARNEGASSEDGDEDYRASSSKFSVTPRSRSLNSSPVSSSENPSLRASERVVVSLFRNGNNTGRVPLPPVVPPSANPNPKPKAKKVPSHQEDVHSLRLLHNHYLQWRFANAKAEASMEAQKREAEKLLYSSSITIAELYDSVKSKRAELGTLRRIKTVSAILDNQMPYLDGWSALEEEYMVSLSESTQALSNALFQLPVGSTVRVDAREVKEAVNSAQKIMGAIAINVQSFLPKAEELEVLVSELARVAGGERLLVGECDHLLSKTYSSQVSECSLRGQIIQLQQLSSANQQNNLRQ